uniref:Allophycocyanin gamma subunit n=1 Tax=Taenioma perpusillum TaxID=210852 RepID=A0A1Z1MRG0_9FLOR|nr:allophycocyanin gamma subunit [Taenioma perpusillum]ARW68412.1 allophycocyanin gamma subunit [Taenioma perpusillum]
MSIVSKVIVNADNELRYPTVGELKSLQDYFGTVNQRVLINNQLRNKEQSIIQLASKAIFKIYPEYIAPGGNAEGVRKRALCLRDYSWYLRLVTYGLLAGDKDSIEKIGLIGVREMYNSLGVPVTGMIDAIECLKNASFEFLDEEQSSLVSPYFDFIIQAMS